MDQTDFSTLIARAVAGLDDVRGCLLVSRDGLTLGSYPQAGEERARRAWDRLESVGEPERGFLVVADELWVFARRGPYACIVVASASSKAGLLLDRMESTLRAAEEARLQAGAGPAARTEAARRPRTTLHRETKPEPTKSVLESVAEELPSIEGSAAAAPAPPSPPPVVVPEVPASPPPNPSTPPGGGEPSGPPPVPQRLAQPKTPEPEHIAPYEPPTSLMGELELVADMEARAREALEVPVPEAAPEASAPEVGAVEAGATPAQVDGAPTAEASGISEVLPPGILGGQDLASQPETPEASAAEADGEREVDAAALAREFAQLFDDPEQG